MFVKLVMSSRSQNERKFGVWKELPNGGRRYELDIRGRHGWWARYSKTVDSRETTISFVQEIYDESDRLMEIHTKYPMDEGHRKV